jgi:putative copper resistance protein D
VFAATDFVVIGLRALGFVATFHAVGAAAFLWLFGKELTVTVDRIRGVARGSAFAAVALVTIHHVLTPARMAGSFAATFDPSLTALLLESDAGTAHIVRLVGLALLAVSYDTPTRMNLATAVTGAALTVVSFALMGHTAIHEERLVLAPLLLVHVAIAAAWFGALAPLALVAAREPPARSAAVVGRFSALATRAVPLILVCGVLMAVLFIRDASELLTAYGALLIGKTAAFAALLGLAAANKWRYAPRLAVGDSRAVRGFKRAVTTEWVLIAAVLMATAAMTALFSPEHLESSFEAHPMAVLP